MKILGLDKRRRLEKVMKTTELIISIMICQMVGVLGSLFAMSSIKIWYPVLEKPFFTSPSRIALSMMIGISAYLIIWEKGLDEKRIRNASGVFLFPLIISVIWSIAFFGMRSIESGLLTMMILGTSILWTMKFKMSFASPLSLYRLKELCSSLQHISPVHGKENPFLNLKKVFLSSLEQSHSRFEGEIGQECPYPKTWTFLTWKFGRK